MKVNTFKDSIWLSSGNIYPTAYISRTAIIRMGTVVEPKAIVNAHSVVGVESIISVGVIVDHHVVVENCCHINSGSIVKAGANIPVFEKLGAGKVVFGYKSAIVERKNNKILV